MTNAERKELINKLESFGFLDDQENSIPSAILYFGSGLHTVPEFFHEAVKLTRAAAKEIRSLKIDLEDADLMGRI